jgi:hypothetical protein
MPEPDKQAFTFPSIFLAWTVCYVYLEIRSLDLSLYLDEYWVLFIEPKTHSTPEGVLDVYGNPIYKHS